MYDATRTKKNTMSGGAIAAFHSLLLDVAIFIAALLSSASPVCKESPVPREPPTGPQWDHEVKFDASDDVAIFTRKGDDYTGRFPAIGDRPFALPTVPTIIAPLAGTIGPSRDGLLHIKCSLLMLVVMN